MSATLKSRFPEIAASMQPIVHAAVREGAELIAERARENVVAVGAVDTGDLRDSIHVTWWGADEEGMDRGASVFAGNHDTFYGHFVEYGSAARGLPPRPFLVPAAEEMQTAVSQIVLNALRAGM
jgi:HK97 gp10 family phage protein